MRLQELLETSIKLSDTSSGARAWIEKIYSMFSGTWQNNHVMSWGEGEDQQLAMFELTPSFSKRGAVDVKWFQAYPLRQGVGSRAMKVLQDLAQKDGISLTLFPWDKGQVSQAKLIKFYKSHGFKPTAKGSKNMYWEPALDEGWKDTLTNLAVAGGVALGGGAGMMAKNAITSPSAQERPAITAPANPEQTQQVQQRKGAASLATQSAPAAQQQVNPEVKKEVVQTITKPAAKVLIATANKAGIKGAELAQFVAQCAHETANFSSLKEYGGKLDFKKYDPKHNPRKAKILGNKVAGDGAKYHGRGYIQLTGRDNYKRAGEALGLPLEKHPELVEKPEVAAKVAVWYWENRVRPNVDNFKDTRAVTKTINSGLKGLEDRHTKFAAIMDIIRGTKG
jgi:predicted chitinase